MRSVPRNPRAGPKGRIDRRGPVRHAVHVTGSDAKRLAEAVKAVRGEMRLSQEEFAERGGIGLASVQRVEYGQAVRPRAGTFDGIDKAARWPAGTARAIFEDKAERPVTAELPTQEGTPVRYYDPATNTVDDRAVIERMIALLPSVRARHGATEAERVRRTIITLAEDAGLIDFASSELDSLDSRRHQIG